MENKIPFYNILNMLLIGIVFSTLLCCANLSKATIFSNYFSLIKTDYLKITVFIALMHEVGLVINRISSIILEPFLKFFNLIYWADYKKYVKAQRNDNFLIVLSREYALSRNSTTLFFILTMIGLICWNLAYSLVMLFLTVLFLISTSKHSKKIHDRVLIKWVNFFVCFLGGIRFLI